MTDINVELNSPVIDVQIEGTGPRGPKGDNDVFIFDIYLIRDYDTEELRFATIYSFNEIMAEIATGKMVFARYDYGNTMLLPLRTANAKRIMFGLDAIDGIRAEIQSGNACLVYTSKQMREWKKNGTSYVVDPFTIYKYMKGYDAENSFKVDITVEEVEIDNPLYPSYSEDETAIIYEYSSNKTFDEIYEAYDDGKNIYAWDTYYRGCDLLKYIPAEGTNLASFVFCREYYGDEAYCYQIFSDDTVESSSIQLVLRNDED